MKAWLREHPHAAAWVVAAALFLIPLQRVESQQADILDLQQAQVQSGYDTCEGQNDLRRERRRELTDEIAQIEQEIAQQRKLHPPDFPGIPPERFRRLKAQGIGQRQSQITEKKAARGRLAGQDCEARYPTAEPEPDPKPGDYRRRQQAAQLLLAGVVVLAWAGR